MMKEFSLLILLLTTVLMLMACSVTSQTAPVPMEEYINEEHGFAINVPVEFKQASEGDIPPRAEAGGVVVGWLTPDFIGGLYVVARERQWESLNAVIENWKELERKTNGSVKLLSAKRKGKDRIIIHTHWTVGEGRTQETTQEQIVMVVLLEDKEYGVLFNIEPASAFQQYSEAIEYSLSTFRVIEEDDRVTPSPTPITATYKVIFPFKEPGTVDEKFAYENNDVITYMNWVRSKDNAGLFIAFSNAYNGEVIGLIDHISSSMELSPYIPPEDQIVFKAANPQLSQETYVSADPVYYQEDALRKLIPVKHTGFEGIMLR